jgi:hypothetical protein
LTEKTIAARDRKWNYNPITYLQSGNGWTNFDNLAHEFMTEDVSFFHCWNVAVVQV